MTNAWQASTPPLRPTGEHYLCRTYFQYFVVLGWRSQDCSRHKCILGFESLANSWTAFNLQFTSNSGSWAAPLALGARTACSFKPSAILFWHISQSQLYPICFSCPVLGCSANEWIWEWPTLKTVAGSGLYSKLKNQFIADKSWSAHTLRFCVSEPWRKGHHTHELILIYWLVVIRVCLWHH